ncbi:hypothetical protein ADL06_08090 [Streptomyces sp. NRRL F-6491]|nr:hypothetical protein ADL06_08090 [Streptomyces sp. NRRL F-6491]KOX42392.1 hypothetical protein ADL08_16850 [Streptomyces sp. NRRL F-6492]
MIRHPRLTSHAVRLLTWQLSLPEDARETLSRTAGRAGIGKEAFTKAKRQLIAEGFVHERRVQVAGGRWVTQQLVSSIPLSREKAVKIFARDPRLLLREPVNPQVVPGPRKPAAGAPGTRSTGGHPEKDLREKTSDLPEEPESVETEPEPETEAGAENPPAPEEARALVGALPLLSPALRNIPPGMRDELARLAARWLEAGHTSADVHEHVLRGLPGAGTPVHRPGGLVRYLLREVAPRDVPAPAPDGPRLSARLAGARECAGEHVQPMLFRPVADETHCRECAPGAGAGARDTVREAAEWSVMGE